MLDVAAHVATDAVTGDGFGRGRRTVRRTAAYDAYLRARTPPMTASGASADSDYFVSASQQPVDELPRTLLRCIQRSRVGCRVPVAMTTSNVVHWILVTSIVCVRVVASCISLQRRREQERQFRIRSVVVLAGSGCRQLSCLWDIRRCSLPLKTSSLHSQWIRERLS